MAFNFNFLNPLTANPAMVGSSQISDAMREGLNNPALKAALAKALSGQPSPQGRVAGGFNMFGPQASQPQAPMLPTPPTPAPVDMSDEPAPPQAPAVHPALSAAALAPPQVPMPMPRPDDAPQAPAPMGFFARNSAMMRDPSSGQFLDPEAASNAQASGPDVINKLMSYFHNKDNPSDG